MIKALIEGTDVEKEITSILSIMHETGPVDPAHLEKLSYIKKYHPALLEKHESKLINIMGLFYKSGDPKSLLDEVYSIYSKAIIDETGKPFTPVQAHAYSSISEKRFFSFSAPTSAGKSFLLRELIKDFSQDIIIVVPSRALISEYMFEVRGLVDSSVLVLQFIDDINTANINRRIFIITPERGAELFKHLEDFNIGLFLLDEAQISEEKLRGMTFDAFVRRIDRSFPLAKKVFAHPFVKNPEAQLEKHGFNSNALAKNYNQHSVGKIFIHEKNGDFDYFSPNQKTKTYRLSYDPVESSLKNNGTLLVYISKGKILNGEYITDFSKYIDLCQPITDDNALKIIDELRGFIGAQKAEGTKHSNMIDMMMRGVVTHHGSMPLKARLLIEEFIKNDFGRICFATSTLTQGINMPFDIVWIVNFRGGMNALDLKNLIGRSGRSTTRTNEFDYGYTIINKGSLPTFKRHYLEEYEISDHSMLDANIEDIQEDSVDIIEALKDGSFNDDLHLTESQIDRLSTPDLDEKIKYILDHLMDSGSPLTQKAYQNLEKETKNGIKDSFKYIYIQHLRRSDLTSAEKRVLSTAISILLWRIEGKSFSEVISLRHAFLSEKDKQRNIAAMLKRDEINSSEANTLLGKVFIRYSQIAATIPNKELMDLPLFRKNTSVLALDYDTLVYDTYDYLDKVISFSLIDPICGALHLYNSRTADTRALVLANYVRHGTNNNTEIWLLRYGYGFEEIEWLKDYVLRIDKSGITFKDKIYDLPEDKLHLVERYL